MQVYGIAFFGSFLYNLLLLVIAKGNCDKAGTDFDLKKYVKANWDNWLATLCLAPVLVWYLPDIVNLVNDHFAADLKQYSVYYLGAGPLTELALFGVGKLTGWKQSFIAPVHKEEEPPKQ